MNDIDIARVVAATRRIGNALYDIDVANADIEEHVRDLLWGSRDLLGNYSAGALLQREVVSGLADRVDHWLFKRSGAATRKGDSLLWNDFAVEVDAALFPRIAP